MPLSWNEIKSRALAFSKHWADAGNEDAEAKPFLIAFFEIFGITNTRVASFEHAVKKHGGGAGYVDLFWPGILLVEMKSGGNDAARVAFLFGRYQQLVAALPAEKPKAQRRKTAAQAD